jgi:hypothetical protein
MSKNKFISLNDDDIKKNENMYSPEQIEYSIIYDCLSLRFLNRYQKLTPYICAKYVIFGGTNEEYGDCTEDRWLDQYDILRRQKHITEDELLEAFRFVEIEEENEKEENKLMSKEDKKY